jgi:general secretion pathway protein J
MAAMAYGSLGRVLDADAHLQQQTARLSATQFAFTRLSEDLRQFTPRAIRDNFGDPQAALQGQETYIQFTRSGWINPLTRPRSNLQRVAWSWQDKKIYRSHWLALDQADDSQMLRNLVLEQVDSLQLRYLDEQSRWHTQWPPENSKPDDNPLLRGIEIRAIIQPWGEIRRVFSLVSNYQPKRPKPNNNAPQ